MNCRFRLEYPGRCTQENVPDDSLGMERCLKKLMREAEATGFQDPEKAARSRWDHLEDHLVLGGLDWKAKKCILSTAGESKN